MERPKLELELHKETRITLLFDDCIEGSSRYGKYYLYAVSNGDGKEYSLFAPEQIHNSLRTLKKGDSALITKTAAQKGSKIIIDYEIKLLQSAEPAKQELPKQQTPTTNNISEDDFYYSAMEKSFDDAFRIQQKFNGVTNISQVPISLFISRTKGNQNILNQ